MFIHQGDQVHRVGFDTGDTLGVTATHPIFSTTYNDWHLAGDLAVGERALSYRGKVTVVSNEKKEGREAVYNLEVKDLHNFMIGAEGVVVHNSCWKWGKIYPYADGADLPERHIFHRHAHNSTYNANKPPNQWKSEFSPEWSSSIEDLKALIDLTLEDGVAKLSN